jgi:hypothetical protein
MPAPTNVYILGYMRPYKETWAGMFVGVYSSLEEAERAIERLRPRQAFRDYPDGFRISCYRIDEDYDDPTFGTIAP